VWEWVEDPSHHNYQGAPDDGSVWIAGGNTTERMLRGGSWSFGPEGLRSAYRHSDFPNNRINVLYGFRLARSASSRSGSRRRRVAFHEGVGCGHVSRGPTRCARALTPATPTHALFEVKARNLLAQQVC
jgi:hypothetical protein